MINPKKKIIDVSKFVSVIICVPSMYVDAVLKKTRFGGKEQFVYSCVKGLMNDGSTVCDYLKKRLKDDSIRFIGGANIDCGDEDYRKIDKSGKLEILGILKNVYAIGFGYYLKEYSPNASAHYLSRVVEELATIGIKGTLLDDLFVSCFSPVGRNRKFGEAMATHKKYSEMTIEGRHTAKIIKKRNLFKNLALLREITDLIYEYK